MLPLNRQGIREAIVRLNDGGLVMLMPDQVPDRKQGFYVPFFGRPTPSFLQYLSSSCSLRVWIGVCTSQVA